MPVPGYPTLQVTPAPFAAPMSVNALLLNGATAKPFEGLWVPLGFVRGPITLEVSGSMDTLGVDLYGSNSPSQPAQGYAVTVGGSVTTDDVSTLTFTNPNLPGGQTTATYKSLGGNGLNDVAAGLRVAVNANPALAALGIVAAPVAAPGAVVTINYPSMPPGQGAAGTYPPAPGNEVAVTGASNGSASETFAVAVLTTGTKIGSTIAAFGWTVLTNAPVAWIKARLTTLTGTGANVTAALQGSA